MDLENYERKTICGHTHGSGEFYAIYSPKSKPVYLNQGSAHLLPSPFPRLIAVFAVSSGEGTFQDVSLKATIINHDNELDCVNIGSITKQSRAFCWQPHQIKEFISPTEHHNYHLHLDPVDQDDHVMESSQTESQEIPRSLLTESQEIIQSELIDSQGIVENQNTIVFQESAKSQEITKSQGITESLEFVESQKITETKEISEFQSTAKSQIITELQDATEIQETLNASLKPEADRLSSTICSTPTCGRKVNAAQQNEETPQLQVQSTPNRPPNLTHSASKKRKAKHGEENNDEGTPPSSRKRQSSRQRQPSNMSSPLSSKVVNTDKLKRLQTPGGRRESDTEPTSRWGHTLCDIGNHKTLLIGGQGPKQTISRDAVWTLNTETGVWSLPSIEASSAKFPSRMGHTATFDHDLDSIFVFGGSKNLRWFNDMHILDLKSMKWSLVEAAGVAPTRAYHSATFFRKELYVFGGVYPNPDPQPDGCSNDVVIFNPESKSWYKPVTMGTKPKPRSGHSATLLGDKLVIFGGWDAPFVFNDLHILDLCLMEFTSPNMVGTPPSPRSWHASIALPGNKVLIHGGYNGNEALSDAFIFHLDTCTWSEVQLHPRVPVGIRAGHAITSYHGNRTSKNNKENVSMLPETLAIFGGGDNEDSFFGDLIPFSWTYSNFLDF